MSMETGCMTVLLSVRKWVRDMSYFSITDFIKSGRKSLENKNYWSALSVALMLPSMCSRIAFLNEKDKYMNFKWNDKSDHSKGKTYTDWKDKDCYIDFCEKVIHDMWLIECLGRQFAKVLYQLRCDIVHAGVANIYDDDKGIYLMLGEHQMATELTKYRTIPVVSLCDTLFNHIDSWCSMNSADNFKYTYVFDNEHSHDDMLLFNRLCDNNRADYLLEQFEKENNERMCEQSCKSQKQK